MTRAGSFVVALATVVVCTTPLVLYQSHRFLVVDRPEPSDVILVPSGDFSLRTSKAVSLYHLGFAPRIVVDEGSDTLSFGRTLAERRKDQVAEYGPSVTICPIRGASTREEASEAKLCLEAIRPQRVLIVTSDFHTRRCLRLFRDEIPGIHFSVAAVPTDYSEQPWWHRESLATGVEEMLGFLEAARL